MDEQDAERMPEQLAREVQRLFDSVVQELGETFSRELLRAEIGYRRLKPIRTIDNVAFPVGTTGCAVALKDVDLILLRAGLEPLRHLFTEFHEGAHLLFGHVPSCPLTLAEFRRCPDLQGAIYRHRATAYDRPREKAAETMATLLVERIVEYEEQKRENSTPPHILDLYG